MKPTLSDPRPAEELYTGCEYADKHPDWHCDGKPKADDLESFFFGVLGALRQSTARVSIADVGCGTGSVLAELVLRATQKDPDICVEGIGFDVSPHAIAIGRARFGNLIQLRQQAFTPGPERYDIVMLIDVLEHLENAWEMLRTARLASQYLLVRQPLLGNYSTFRHNNYRNQRKEWGHIGFFTFPQFLDMTEVCGWTPRDVTLTPPWQLFPNQPNPRRPGIVKTLLHFLSPLQASFFVSGYYAIGWFE